MGQTRTSNILGPDGRPAVLEVAKKSFPNLDPMYPNPMLSYLANDSVMQTSMHPYQNHSWVYTCAKAYARNLTSLPRWMVPKNTPTKFLTEHPIYEVWKDPNPFMNSAQLWEAIILNLLLPTSRSPGGQCFLILTGQSENEKVDILRGEIPFQIWPYSDEVIKPRMVGNRFLGWQMNIAGEDVINFEPHEVVRIRLFNPGNPLRGLAPFSPVRNSVELDAKAVQFDQKILDNGGVLQGLLTTDQTLNVDTLKEMDAMWRANFGGSKNAGKTAILANGLKYQELAHSAAEMSFLESRKYARDEILAAYHVPKWEAGIYEDINYATAQMAEKHFWGVLKSFDKAMWLDINDNWLRFLDKGRSLGISDYSEVESLQDDYKDKITAMKTMYDMGVPVARSAKLLRIPLELESWNDSVLVPSTQVDIQELEGMNAAKVEQMKKPIPAPLSPGAKPDPNAEPPADEIPPADPKSKTIENSFADIGAMVKAQRDAREALWNEHVTKVFDPGEKAVRKEIEAYFVKQRNFMQDKVDTWRKRNEKAAPMTRDTEPVPEDFLPSDKEANEQDAKLKAAMGPLYDAMVIRAADKLGDELGGLVEWNSDNPYTAKVKAERLTAIPEINTTTFQRAGAVIAEVIDKGTAEHQTPAEIAKALKSGIFDVYQIRINNSKIIARTETAIISSGTRFGIMQTEGIEDQEWLSAHDDLVRESHQEEDGNVVKVGDVFPVTGLHYPSDPEGAADEVIGCRCVALARRSA